MEINWQTRKLGEVCELIKGKKPKIFVSKSNKPYLTAKVIRKIEKPRFVAENDLTPVWVKKEDIVIIMDGSNSGEMFTGLEGILASTMGIVNYPNDLLDPKFLLHFLTTLREDFTKSRTGAAIPHLNKEGFENLEIPIPPLREQHRIVEILDEVLDRTATVKGNTEKNLQNSKELFESYLQSQKGEKTELVEIVDIKTGKLNANAMMEGGKYPFFTCAKEIYAINKYAFDCEAILLAGNNAVGNFNVKHYKGKFNAYQRTYIITVKRLNRVLYRYLYFQLLNSLKDFKAKSVGSGTKFLKLGMIQNLGVILPSLSKQKIIVKKLDALLEETKKLEKIYEHKLTDLEELKKSVFSKAFRGEL